jgi:hypothetical protein
MRGLSRALILDHEMVEQNSPGLQPWVGRLIDAPWRGARKCVLSYRVKYLPIGLSTLHLPPLQGGFSCGPIPRPKGLGYNL